MGAKFVEVSGSIPNPAISLTFESQIRTPETNPNQITIDKQENVLDIDREIKIQELRRLTLSNDEAALLLAGKKVCAAYSLIWMIIFTTYNCSIFFLFANGKIEMVTGFWLSAADFLFVPVIPLVRITVTGFFAK